VSPLTLRHRLDNHLAEMTNEHLLTAFVLR
jgi:hypothetical protein